LQGSQASLGFSGREFEAFLLEMVPAAEDMVIQNLPFFQGSSFMGADSGPDCGAFIRVPSHQKVERSYRDLI